MRKILAISFLALSTACRSASVIPADGNNGNIPGPTTGGTISIAYLKTLYTGAPTRIDRELYISGAVVSDDREGNFYKTLVLDDGTGGIEMRIDVEQIFKIFMIHTRVTVRCNGLWLGSYGGTLQLGAEPWDNLQTQPLSQTAVAEHLGSDNTFWGEVRPRTLTFGGLSGRDVSTFVAFEGVRFITEEEGMSWAEPVYIAPATDRHLVDAEGDTLTVRTSGLARFATWRLPEGVGRVEGVLGLFNDRYQLVVADSEKFAQLRD
jgi:hypothetical protein